MTQTIGTPRVSGTSTKSRSRAYRRVTLDLPLELWGKLATAADHEGGRIAEIIQTSIEQVLRVPASQRAQQAIDDRVMQALVAGWDDWTIAEQLEITAARVASIRVRAGMQPHPSGQGTGRI